VRCLHTREPALLFWARSVEREKALTQKSNRQGKATKQQQQREHGEDTAAPVDAATNSPEEARVEALRADAVREAETAVAAGDFVLACEKYSAAVCHAPQDASLLIRRAACYTSLGRLDDALADSEKAVACKPRLAQAYAALGAALQRTGRRDDAVAALRRAVELDKKRELVSMLCGSTHSCPVRDVRIVLTQLTHNSLILHNVYKMLNERLRTMHAWRGSVVAARYLLPSFLWRRNANPHSQWRHSRETVLSASGNRHSAMPAPAWQHMRQTPLCGHAARHAGLSSPQALLMACSSFGASRE
jgi:tetratricopeptide (TPR) repeat protein